MRHPIGGHALKHAARQDAVAYFRRGVGAAIEDDVHGVRQKMPFGVYGGPQRDVCLVPGVVRCQRFGIAQDRLDRSARGAGQEIAQQLVVDLTLATEIAANVVRVYVD